MPESEITPNRQTLKAKKGGNKHTQLEIENPSTVVMTDNQKAISNVKEKGSNTRKN